MSWHLSSGGGWEVPNSIYLVPTKGKIEPEMEFPRSPPSPISFLRGGCPGCVVLPGATTSAMELEKDRDGVVGLPQHRSGMETQKDRRMSWSRWFTPATTPSATGEPRDLQRSGRRIHGPMPKWRLQTLDAGFVGRERPLKIHGPSSRWLLDSNLDT